jgi:hypothetical protein
MTVAVLLRAGGPAYVKGILYTTVRRQTGNMDQPMPAVVWLGFTYVWVIVFLCLIGFAASFASRWPDRVFRAALLFGVLAAPLNEARIHTYSSLYKHVVFGAWFGAIAAGWVIAKATEVSERKGWRIATAVLAVAALAGYGQGSTQFAWWPDTTGVLRFLHPRITPASGPIALSSDNRWALTYYLGAETYPGQLTDIIPASIPRIRRGGYLYVEVDTTAPLSGTWADGKQQFNEGQEALAAVIEATPGYRLVYTEPWVDAFYTGEFRVWQYERPAR